MPTEISNVYIFVPLSSDENHFFLSSGFVEANNLPDLIEFGYFAQTAPSRSHYTAPSF